MKAIYKIQNKITGEMYVGCTSDFERRKYEHLNALYRGQHPNSRLQKAWDNFQENNFSFEILEQVASDSELFPKEQHYIELLQPDYNIMPGDATRRRERKKPIKKHRERPTANLPKLFTVKEAAKHLGLTRRTIYTYIENKTLPAVKIGKEWRVKKTELEAFINRGSGEIKDKNV